MIEKFRIDESVATQEFGMACQRLVPWPGQQGEPPVGAMACFLEPGASSDPDCHNQDEVMFVLSGSGIVELAGESAPITTGDVIVLPRNQEHVVRNEPDGAKLVWISAYWPLREPEATR